MLATCVVFETIKIPGVAALVVDHDHHGVSRLRESSNSLVRPTRDESSDLERPPIYRQAVCQISYIDGLLVSNLGSLGLDHLVAAGQDLEYRGAPTAPPRTHAPATTARGTFTLALVE